MRRRSPMRASAREHTSNDVTQRLASRSLARAPMNGDNNRPRSTTNDNDQLKSTTSDTNRWRATDKKQSKNARKSSGLSLSFTRAPAPPANPPLLVMLERELNKTSKQEPKLQLLVAFVAIVEARSVFLLKGFIVNMRRCCGLFDLICYHQINACSLFRDVFTFLMILKFTI